MNVPNMVASMLLLLSLAPLPALADDESDAVIPRTASGRPDLSGNYDISTLTPLERRPELGTRRAYTADEVAEIQGRAVEREIAGNLPSDPDRDAPPAGARVGGYNAFFIDRGTSPVLTKGEYRTSIIIDPPNGRFPPLTERGRELDEARRIACRIRTPSPQASSTARPFDSPASGRAMPPTHPRAGPRAARRR